MAHTSDIHQLSESLLRFNPKWWWDPVPPWFIEHLTDDIARDLTRIQLEKQMRILEIQQKAVKQTLDAIGRAK